MRETELKEEDLRHREKAIKKQEEELRTREIFFGKIQKEVSYVVLLLHSIDSYVYCKELISV
jgi:hypothetical protein